VTVNAIAGPAATCGLPGVIVGTSTKDAAPEITPVPGCGAGGDPSDSGWTICTAWTPAGKPPGGSVSVMLSCATAPGVSVTPLTSTWVVAGAVAARLVPPMTIVAPSTIAPTGSAASTMLPITGSAKGWAMMS
jgi:hypothetical protein